MAKLTTRTLTTTTVTADNKPKGSALTHNELDSNFLNLETDKLENTTDDFTGTLSIKGSGASAVGQIDFYDNDDSNYLTVKATATISANYTLTLPDNDGDSGQVLTTDGSGVLTWTSKTVDTTNLVDDTTPQLGGDLDVNGQSIVSVSNGNIVLAPNGTGEVHIDTSVIEQYTGKGIIIHDQAQGSFADLTSQGSDFGSVYGNGLAFEKVGGHGIEINMWAHKANSGYANIWAHRSRDDGAGNKDYLNTDDTVFRFFGSGWGGGADTPANFYGAYAPMGSMDLIASENHSSSALGGRWEFKTTSTGATSETEKLTVENDVVVNKPRGDVDFIVNGDTNFDVFKVDAGTEIVSTGGVFQLYSASADPSSNLANGQMYYNTTTNKFRGYANGAWVDLH